MSWINKILPSISTSSIGGKNKSSVPEGLWKKCPRCDQTLYRGDLERNLEVCPKCDHHMRITARRRIELFLDEEGQAELLDDIAPVDILKFKDLKKYKDRLSAAQKKTGEKDALIVFRGAVNGTELVAVAFEFGFIGGSMGAVVGEKFTQAVNVCVGNKLPLVCFSTSGGARMQEALVSLMQMAKTAAAIARLREKRLPFISVLVDPVYGGVSASLAMMGDINIAEPNALVGFTGPDVIRQTVRVKLPDGFQRSEFLLEHGAIDMIVHRKQLRNRIVALIRKLMYDRYAAPQPVPDQPPGEDAMATEELAGIAAAAEVAGNNAEPIEAGVTVADIPPGPAETAAVPGAMSTDQTTDQAPASAADGLEPDVLPESPDTPETGEPVDGSAPQGSIETDDQDKDLSAEEAGGPAPDQPSGNEGQTADDADDTVSQLSDGTGESAEPGEQDPPANTDSEQLEGETAEGRHKTDSGRAKKDK